MAEGIVELNVGGRRFMTTKDTLTKNSNTMFAAMFSGNMNSTQDGTGAYFIDRDGTHFHTILNYLRDGECSLPALTDVCARQELLQEARYYALDGLVAMLQPAGQQVYNNAVDRLLDMTQHQRATGMLWQAAFAEPLSHQQVLRTWVKLTFTSEQVSIKGPARELVFQHNDNCRRKEEGLPRKCACQSFQTVLSDARYLHEVRNTLLPLHFEERGIICSSGQDTSSGCSFMLEWNKKAWPVHYQELRYP